MSTTSSLSEIADQAMLDKGFLITYPEEVKNFLDTISGPAVPIQSEKFKDLRDKVWVSIDNDDSKDLDQLTYTERTSDGKDRVFVAVADVDALVTLGNPIDRYAYQNTTSVYTPDKIYPMLPLKLSTDLTSLNENEDRCAIIIEYEVTADGEYKYAGIYPGWVRNHAKLAYNAVGTWLEGQGPLPSSKTHKLTPDELANQLKLQDALSQKIKKFRNEQGALNFGSIELQPIIANASVISLKQAIHNRAHELIENFMIAANVIMTEFLTAHHLPTLRRIVRTPERWGRIVDLARDLGEKLPSEPDAKALQELLIRQKQKSPDTFPDLSLAIIKLIGRGEYYAAIPGEVAPGHFDLALEVYAHTTAPNRRYPDLVMHRLLKSQFYDQQRPYTSEQLDEVAAQCTKKEADASKVERRMMKSAAASFLSNQIGKEFQGIVTGANSKGTWVRLFNPPIEGKVIQGIKGLDVGDKIKVKLVHTDVINGYIDFVRV